MVMLTDAFCANQAACGRGDLPTEGLQMAGLWDISTANCACSHGLSYIWQVVHQAAVRVVVHVVLRPQRPRACGSAS